MTSLNIKSTGIFIQLATMADQNEGHIKIQNNDSFMAVSVERLYDFKFGEFKAIMYSMAHYGELNGDLMADPEMTFIFVAGMQRIYPASFTNHYAGVYQECIFEDNGTWKISKKGQHDLALFADEWMVNIKDQQEL